MAPRGRMGTAGVMIVLLSGCFGGEGGRVDPAQDVAATMAVGSNAFLPGERIPPRFTCDGEDVSPPLAFGGVPEGTRTFALVLDDPDAPRGTFTHWTFWNLPREQTNLAAGVQVTAFGAREGKTGFGDTGYGGPCPPSGTHRYFFRAYAVDGTIDLEAGADVGALSRALVGRVLASGELMGTYARP